MLPILYDGTSYSDNSFGLGVLSDAISAEVEEERNGIPELTMRYPISGQHYSNIALRRIIKAKPNFTDDPQLFRIYRITKPISGVVTIYARHISSDLSDKLVPVGTNGSSCAAACAALSAIASPFTITTDKSVTGTWRATEPASIRAWFGGRSGSLLDVYGAGEWYYNGTTCQLLLHRGSNRGVVIRYGKNLTELTAESDCTNMASSVLPYYMDTDGNVITGTAVSTGMTAFTREIAVDFSSDFQETPTAAQLTERCQAYVNANNFTAPKGNITLDFVQIGKLKDRVDLCDTVTIEYEALGITASVECIRTLWDVLDEHYIETEFGDPKELVTDTIVAVSKTANEAVQVSTLRAAVNRATDAITGQNGGFFVENDTNGDGLYDEVLFLNTTDLSAATKVWRWNLGGLGYSGTGYAGPYTTAIYDGHIVADFVDTGTLNANIIKAGILQDAVGLNYWNMETGELSLNVTGTVQSITTYYAESLYNSPPQWDYPKAYLYDSNGAALYDSNGDRLVARQIWTTTAPTSATKNYRWMRNYIVYKDDTTQLTSAVPMQDYYGRANLVIEASTDGNGNPVGVMSGVADYMKFSAGQLEIFSPQFQLDRNGNATFAGNLSAATGTFRGSVIAESITLVGGAEIDANKVAGLQDKTVAAIRGTVNAGYVNGLHVVAGEVAAENISGTRISGKEFVAGLIKYDDDNYWDLRNGVFRIKSFNDQFADLNGAISTTDGKVENLKLGFSVTDSGVIVGRQNANIKGVFDNDSLEFQTTNGTPIAWFSSDASDGLGVDLIQIGSHETVSQRWIVKTEQGGDRLTFTRRAS
ncbi:MAG: phage tail protein [Firmicutes bacterium]|nr:phage tail protein [Bacillota bacterium]